MIPLIPMPWKLACAAALVLAVFAGGYHRGADSVQADWDADKLARTSRENDAIRARIEQNASIGAQQATINTTITKAKNDEIAPVRERIVTKRVYVGPAICAGAAAAPEAESAAGGDRPDPGARLLPPEMERDIRALILETEEAAATGRACQAWVREHGFEP